MESARAILQARPLDEEAYFRWSDDAREKIAAAYGAESPQTREFFRSRWVVSKTATDPSAYLTQIGANLRRELRTFQKLERQGGPPETPPPASKPAAAKPNAEPATEEAPSHQPPAAEPGEPAAATRVLILGGANEADSKRAAEIVEGLDLSAIEVAEQYREALAQLGASAGGSEIAAALVFVDPDPKSSSSKPSPQAQSVLELGVLIGALGPERIVVLVSGAVSMPRLAREVRQIRLSGGESFEGELVEWFQAVSES